MQTNDLAPVAQSSRVKIIDILRGWALLGVVLMNYVNYADFATPLNKTDNLISQIGDYMFSVKSWSLLSVLFGFGFGALYEKVRRTTDNPTLFFLRRMAILFLISILNIAFYSGDILHDYALLGCILLLFANLAPKKLFIISICFLLVNPVLTALVSRYIPLHIGEETKKLLHQQFIDGDFMTVMKRNFISCYLHEIKSMNYTISVHLQMFSLMLLGFAGYKAGFFERLAEKKKLITYICIISFIAALILVESNILVVKNNLSLNKYYHLFWIEVECTVVFLATLIALIYIRYPGKGIVHSTFLYSGRMTLTNYMLQSLLIFLIFSGAGLGLAFRPDIKLYYGIALAVFICQAVFSVWWLKKFQYGPVEWFWRCLSYGRWFKNKTIGKE